MRALTARELVEVWERGAAQSPAERPLTMLAPVAGELTVDALARLPIGRRDAMLLRLREALAGTRMTSLCRCPECRAELELELDLRDIRVNDATSDSDGQNTIVVRVDGYEATFRLPTTLDLIDASRRGPDGAPAHLLERCVVAASHWNGDVNAGELPRALAMAAIDRMADADPQADIQFALDCPECHHTWSASFDIAAYLWTEIQASARRLLYEVHELAQAYGWREHDILDMTPARRQAYLDLVRV